MQKQGPPPFEAETPYRIEIVADFLGQTVDWVKRNAIKTGELQHSPLGNSYVVLGKWIANYVISKGTFEGDANCPKSNRGGKRPSPRKKTNDAGATS